jgi:MFS superfamily sulfate permease-like transporter
MEFINQIFIQTLQSNIFTNTITGQIPPPNPPIVASTPSHHLLSLYYNINIMNLRSITQHNVRTIRTSPLGEISGALGDLGTLLPLMIAMAIHGSINLGSTLVFSGLANILTGICFGIPLPVQPMKAIAAVTIRQGLDQETTAAAGLIMGVAVFLLSATGALRLLHRIVPVSVVKGIQVGAGLSLVISAGSGLIQPLGWISPGYDNRIWSIAAFLFLLLATRIPYALVVFIIGIIIAAVIPGGGKSEAIFWNPSLIIPSAKSWRIAAVEAALPQLPLTTLNSVLAVASLASTLFPESPTPTTTSIGFSVALANLIGCWFGAMPICHGSGGLAAQYRFGARSGASIIILGSIKLLLGLFIGEAIIPLLQRFPKSLLGVMVLGAGVELAKVAQDLDTEDGQNQWMVMLVTISGCLAFKNDAVGFIAGLIWYWGLKLPDMMVRSVRLENEEDL